VSLGHPHLIVASRDGSRVASRLKRHENDATRTVPARAHATSAASRIAAAPSTCSRWLALPSAAATTPPQRSHLSAATTVCPERAAATASACATVSARLAGTIHVLSCQLPTCLKPAVRCNPSSARVRRHTGTALSAPATTTPAALDTTTTTTTTSTKRAATCTASA
jgi:hypothetical protein